MKHELELSIETRKIIQDLIEALNNIVDATGYISEKIFGEGWHVKKEKEDEQND